MASQRSSASTASAHPVAVGRSEDGRLKIGAQVVPKPVGTVQLAVAHMVQEVLESVRFGRIQEAEYAPLVLTEAPPRNWAKEARSNRMQRPACFEHLGQPPRLGGAVPACDTCDGRR